MSFGLSAVCRLAFSPVRSLSRSAHALAIGIRYASSTPSQRRPITPEIPRVGNMAAYTIPKDTKWYENTTKTISQLEMEPVSNPYSGRTVTVKNLGDSLKVLDGILARNKVKMQLRLTERHEKKGYKRRRLASERWRSQFANEVRKKVQLVMKMRDRGA